ncbi:hypothetical protein EW145_g1573 [Phellinidium pouzarii]|uniref:phenylalanine--tRNA ligase n=1 Tax=Phellinidium pouzarii TaxID=167371 RepID=A0A4S4LFS1_9AGAM|nr:hypothetical protein EW145_g1573 [Phellinidium pouzarii]
MNDSLQSAVNSRDRRFGINTEYTECMMEAIQELILKTLESEGSIKDTRDLVLPGESSPAISQDAQLVILGVLNSLSSREMINYTTQEIYSHVLTPEGAQIALEGSHEARVWAAVPPKGEGKPIAMKELVEKIGTETSKVGQGNAFKNGWIGKEGVGFVKLVPEITDSTQLEMREVDSTGTLKSGERSLALLRKRKLITQKKGQWFAVHKGPEFSTSLAKPETDLSSDMLVSGSWKNATFKKYNFEAMGVPPNGGAQHPLLKVREEFRNIFLEMGFAEMPTASYVESSFWCFDALFVPQQHPARDLQDTFYLRDPATSLDPPEEYYKSVSEVHEHGGYGSLGYRAPWDSNESRRLLLRTHTTASSSRLLREIATQPGGFKPAKLFSIDRVFRNEATDATHLAEFHQVEGVVADRNLTLADLIGFMKTFFNKMGLQDLRFKPAYNPYTEHRKAFDGNLCVPSYVEEMGRNWKQWHVPT